jgi:hypothetical protein
MAFSLATNRHLQDLKCLPNGTPLKNAMIEAAERRIEIKRREGQRPK